MSVSYSGPDTGGSGKLLPGRHEPPPIALGFNARFLYDPYMYYSHIEDKDDYFAYGIDERQRPVSSTAVVETIDYKEDFYKTAEGFPEEFFIGQWTGLVVISKSGSYTFSSTSDDGSHVWINGALVVSNGGIHGYMKRATGTVQLDAGRHTFRADFFHHVHDVTKSKVNPRTLNHEPQTTHPKPQTPNAVCRVDASEVLWARHGRE